jgi:hypothetical protein
LEVKVKEYGSTLKDATQYAEQLVGDKIRKDAYIEKEKSLKQKQEALMSEIRSLQRGL